MNDIRIPPHSDEAERAVLGSVLCAPDRWPDVSHLTASDFYRSDHARIYAALAEAIEAGDEPDPVTVAERLEARGADYEAGGLPYLVDLMDMAAAPANAGAYARIVRDRRRRRDAIRLVVEAGGALSNGFRGQLTDIVGPLTEALRELADDQADAGPKLASMADVLAIPDEALSFVVSRLLPRAGVSLLVAFAKAGKTTLAAVLALAVAKGVRFLGRETERGTVLYLGFEDHPVAFRDRLRALGATADDPIYSMTGYLPHGLDSLSWLRALVERHRPVLIIADTMIRLVRLADMNDYAAVSPALEPYFTLARESGAHLMMLHHSRKEAGDFGLDVLGSQALPGGVDTVLSLKRDPNTGARFIQSENRYGQAFEPTLLRHDADTGRVELGVRRADERHEEIEESILDFAAAAPEPLLLTDIARASEISGRGKDIRAAVKRLARTGRLTMTDGARAGSFRYAVPHATGMR